MITLAPPRAGLYTYSTLIIVKSQHSYLAQNNNSKDALFIANQLSLEFRLDAEHMSKLAFYSGANTIIPYKTMQIRKVANHHKIILILLSTEQMFFSYPFSNWGRAFWGKNLIIVLVMFLFLKWYFLWKWKLLWEWFVESVLNPAQDICYNLQCDGMAHCIPTHTIPRMAVVLSKWNMGIFAAVWSPILTRDFNIPVTEIEPSLAEVNTMGPLNSWSNEMRVHGVLMGV